MKRFLIIILCAVLMPLGIFAEDAGKQYKVNKFLDEIEKGIETPLPQAEKSVSSEKKKKTEGPVYNFVPKNTAEEKKKAAKQKKKKTFFKDEQEFINPIDALMKLDEFIAKYTW